MRTCRMQEYMIERGRTLGWAIHYADATEKYRDVVGDAFEATRISKVMDSYKPGYTLMFYLQSPNKPQNIEDFLSLLQRHPFVDLDLLDQCFALDLHYEQGERTEIGDLVYQAKPYPNKPRTDARAANELARRMFGFIERHPSYRRSDLILTVPKPGTKSFSSVLSDLLARIMKEKGLDIPFTPNIMRATRKTQPQKDMETKYEARQNVKGAFALEREAEVLGKRVLIVDDVCRSGATLEEISSVLREAGASYVMGLVCTKTARDL